MDGLKVKCLIKVIFLTRNFTILNKYKNIMTLLIFQLSQFLKDLK